MKKIFLSKAILLMLVFCRPVFAVEAKICDPGTPGFNLPIDFAPGIEGAVAVLEDLGNKVQLSHGRKGSASLEGLEYPKTLAADDTGLLLVYEITGVLIAFEGEKEIWRVEVQGDVFPQRPVGLAARSGTIWVVDGSPQRIFLYAYDGASLGVFDIAKWARAPFSVALGSTGEAFIADPMGPAVLTFSPAGTYMGSIDLEGTGVTRPTGVAVDTDGHLWVSDGVSGRVVSMSPSGDRPEIWCGGKRLHFDDPIRLSWTDNALWVLEGRIGRVRKVEMEK